MDASLEKQRLVRWLRAEMSRQAGRTYDRIELEAMSVEGLRDLQRLLRDLDAEKRMAVQRAQLTPWRST